MLLKHLVPETLHARDKQGRAPAHDAAETGQVGLVLSDDLCISRSGAGGGRGGLVLGACIFVHTLINYIYIYVYAYIYVYIYICI